MSFKIYSKEVYDCSSMVLSISWNIEKIPIGTEVCDFQHPDLNFFQKSN